MPAKTYSIPNISCGHCANTIQMELMEIPGVNMVSASEETKEVVIEFEDPATAQQIEATLEEINYPVAN
jgi:copper chaperone CopZ